MTSNSLTHTPGNQLHTIGNQTASISHILNQSVKENPYTSRITRDTPTAFVFLIDQSWSMSEEIIFNGETMSKASAVAKAVNAILTELLGRCTKGNELYHYYDIALLGYGGDKSGKAYSLFTGALKDREWASPSEMNEYPLREEKITETKVVRGKSLDYEKTIKCWIDPVAEKNTPMFAAFGKAIELLEAWLKDHVGKDCYPPVVINITDGEATDATDDDLLEVAKRLKSLSTIDGNVLLINSHLSNAGIQLALFPRDRRELPDDRYARLLFDMASDMPDNYKLDIVSLKKAYDLPQEPPFKGMCFDAEMSGLVKMLNIGTQTK